MQPAPARTRESAGIPAAIAREYEQPRPRSQAMFTRAKAALPGGETRAVTHFAPFPLSLESGSGQFVTDVDGISYLDIVINYTSLVHGYDFRPIVEAQTPTLTEGTVPIGAVGGRAELLQLTAPLLPSRIEHAGTFNGHIAAVAGGLVALQHLDRAADRHSELARRAPAGGDRGSGRRPGRSRHRDPFRFDPQRAPRRRSGDDPCGCRPLPRLPRRAAPRPPRRAGVHVDPRHDQPLHGACR
ncbi:MAG: Beta-phenylalanine transaminase [Naasia sp.]|nr:Beta-phenylalanine transaminase [Naasia sp.]